MNKQLANKGSMSNWVDQHLRSAILLSLSLVAALLSGCASPPTRADAEAFSLLAQGQIAPAQVQAFASCLLDGFDKAHFILSNVTSRQQRRGDSYRVETLSGGRIILVSADVYDNGRVALNEGKAAALIDTSGEREAFAQCLSKFSIAR